MNWLNRLKTIQKATQITTPGAKVIDMQTGNADLAKSLPSWCQAGCTSLDVISGPGCVRTLNDGLWGKEWRSLDKMTSCPKKHH